MAKEDPRWQEIDKKLAPDDHARIVQRQLEQLDRTVLDELYRGVGKSAYDPLCLLAMALYQQLKGRHSPAAWAEEARLNEAMQWLGQGYAPARRTWYDFRDRMEHVIEPLHENLIENALEQGHLDPSTGVLDGTSIAACASRHRMVNRPTLVKRQQLLAEIIEHGEPTHEELPKWVPPTNWGRLDLAKRMQTAEEILDRRIAENAARPSGKRKNPDKIQVSLSDPIAPLGRDKRKVYRPLYTVQAVVDPSSLLIVSYDCAASATDNGTLAPMIDKTQRIVGGQMKRVLADGGYCSTLDLSDAKERGVELLAPPPGSGGQRKCKSRSGSLQISRDEFHYDADADRYHCPQGEHLNYRGREKKVRQGGRSIYQRSYQCAAEICGACPLADQCLSGKGPRMIKRMEGEELLEAQRTRMSAEDAKAAYRLRGQTVELAFGDVKGNRRVERYHGRGLARARTETGLLVLTQNLLRLDRLQRNAQNPAKHAA